MKPGMVLPFYKTPASGACSDNAMRVRRLILEVNLGCLEFGLDSSTLA
jgi:hypothetical protein